jgi:hypothetical protein
MLYPKDYKKYSYIMKISVLQARGTYIAWDRVIVSYTNLSLRTVWDPSEALDRPHGMDSRRTAPLKSISYSL